MNITPSKAFSRSLGFLLILGVIQSFTSAVTLTETSELNTWATYTPELCAYKDIVSISSRIPSLTISDAMIKFLKNERAFNAPITPVLLMAAVETHVTKEHPLSPFTAEYTRYLQCREILEQYLQQQSTQENLLQSSSNKDMGEDSPLSPPSSDPFLKEYNELFQGTLDKAVSTPPLTTGIAQTVQAQNSLPSSEAIDHLFEEIFSMSYLAPEVSIGQSFDASSSSHHERVTLTAPSPVTQRKTNESSVSPEEGYFAALKAYHDLCKEKDLKMNNPKRGQLFLTLRSLIPIKYGQKIMADHSLSNDLWSLKNKIVLQPHQEGEYRWCRNILSNPLSWLARRGNI